MTYKDDYMSWSSGFSASLFLQNEIVPNSYSIEITFETLTNNILHQNISFERVKHMINVYLQNAMIVKYDNPKIDLLKNFKVNLLTTPLDPIDSIIGICLHKKLTSITDSMLTIGKFTIQSWQGDHIKYEITNDMPEYALLDKHNIEKTIWWNHAGPQCHHKSLHFLNNMLFNYSWKDVKLNYDAETEQTESKFHPVILDGGKNED